MRSHLSTATRISLALLVATCQPTAAQPKPAAEAAKQAEDGAAINRLSDGVALVHTGDTAAVVASHTEGAIDTARATVRVDSLPVRSQPFAESPVLTSLRRGDVVVIDFALAGSEGSWCGMILTAGGVRAGYVGCAGLDGEPRAGPKVSSLPAPIEEERRPPSPTVAARIAETPEDPVVETRETPCSEGSYGIQVGAFRSSENAKRTRDEMVEKYGLARVYTQREAERTLYRVLVGCEENRGAARSLASRLHTAGIQGYVVRHNARALGQPEP